MPYVRVSIQEILHCHSLSLTPDLETPRSHCALSLLETHLHVWALSVAVWKQGPLVLRVEGRKAPVLPRAEPQSGRKDCSVPSVSAFLLLWPVLPFQCQPLQV